MIIFTIMYLLFLMLSIYFILLYYVPNNHSIICFSTKGKYKSTYTYFVSMRESCVDLDYRTGNNRTT